METYTFKPNEYTDLKSQLLSDQNQQYSYMNENVLCKNTIPVAEAVWSPLFWQVRTSDSGLIKSIERFEEIKN